MYWCLILLQILVFYHCLISSQKLETNKGAVIDLYQVYTTVHYRFATTYVTNHVTYDDDQSNYVTFNITIPDKAMVTNFTMQVNETVFRGYVTTRDVSRQISLTSAVEGHRYGRLFTRTTRRNGFIVRERVQGRTRLIFNLTYIEILQRQGGKYVNRIYITPDHPVRSVNVEAEIREPQRVIKADLISTDNSFTDGVHDIGVAKDKTTLLQYRQNYTGGSDVHGSISLEYFLGEFFGAGDILISKEYFVHYFSPKIVRQPPKHVLFLLDVSGSMTNNNRLNQLKAAMTAILNSLKAQDRFNVMPFTEDTWTFSKEGLLKGSEKNKAIKQIKALKASGDTDISKAILRGMSYLNQHPSITNNSFIFFITDGHPTSGISDTRRILELVRATNRYNLPIFTLAFGKDADWHLARSLAAENFGQSRRILTTAGSPTSAADEIIQFYKEVSSFVLSGVEFTYWVNGEFKTNYNLIRQNLRNYYRGSEMVVCGQLQTKGNVTSYKYLEGRVTGSARSGLISVNKSSPAYRKENDWLLERIWYYLVIENLIRQHELALDSTQRKWINTRLQRMALKYNVVTPITVMLADASTDSYYGEDISSFNAGKPLELTAVDSVGKKTVVLKPEKRGPINPPSRFTSEGGRDPHFVIQSPNLEYPVCFNVVGRSNDIIQLINDLQSGIRVNIQIHQDQSSPSRFFITQIGIICQHFKLVAKRHFIYIDNKAFHWNVTKTKVYKEAEVHIFGGKQMRVELSNGLVVRIENRVRHDGGYFFNIGIEREEKLSSQTAGLLGLFLHRMTSQIPDDHRPKTRILKTSLNGYCLESKARLVERLHPITEQNVTCWSVPLKGAIMKTGALFKIRNILK